jgi:hypothetical protein
MEENKSNKKLLDAVLLAVAMIALAALIYTLIVSDRPADAPQPSAANQPQTGGRPDRKHGRIGAPRGAGINHPPGLTPGHSEAGTASISGKVFYGDETSNSAGSSAEVRLMARNADGTPGALIDAVRAARDGAYKFEFYLEKENTFVISASNPMYKSGYFSSAIGLAVKPGDVYTDINIYLSVATLVTIYVFDELDNTPVAGAKVKIAFGMNSFAEGETQTAGEFRFEAPGPGAFGVDVSAPCYAPVRFNRGFAIANEFLGVGLKRAGALAGRVTNPKGNPVAGARITFHGLGDSQTSAATDADGKYLIEGLAPCTGEVLAAAETFGQSISAFVEISEGETTYHDVTLESGAGLFGTVVDADDGKPVRDARLLLNYQHFHTPLNYRAASYADGKFRFNPRLGSGVYYIYIIADGYRPATIENIDFNSANGDRELKIELLRGCSIKGRLVNSAGAPLKNEPVAAIDRFNRSFDATSREDGRFDIAGLYENESYTVEIIPRQRAYIRMEKIPGGMNLGDITVEAFGLITGIVEWDGVPIQGATVLFWTPEDPFTKHAVDTNENGGFSFSACKPGTYSVEISVDGYAPYKADDIKAAESVSTYLGLINLKKK